MEIAPCTPAADLEGEIAVIKSVVVAVVSLLATASVAVAGDSASQRAACTPDVMRLCATDIPDIGAIKTCLRRERSRLSPACRIVMDTADKPSLTVAAK